MQRRNFAQILTVIRPSAFPIESNWDRVIGIQSDCFLVLPPPVFPDGQVSAAAGAGPAAMPRDGGGVEEDAPRQEEETERPRGEGKGK